MPANKIAVTKRKNTPLYNLQKNESKIEFFRKLDGAKINLPLMSDKPYHTHSFHKRLDCSACHTQWIPSCYGCHEVYFKNSFQYDWIKHKKTKGRWFELRSYLRFEDKTLSVSYNKKIMPSAPGCQVIMSIYDDKNYTKSFDSLAYGAWEPHSVGKSKRCIDCHFNPTAVGLGNGVLDLKNEKVTFKPFFDSKASGFDFDFPIDALVDTNGTQLQSFSRDNARGFNKDEIEKIIKAYRCIICHESWDDKIYNDFNHSKKLFFSKKTKCSAILETDEALETNR
jgi:hypothetical protein